MKKYLLIIIIIILLSGCNYRELNDLAIVTAINLDKENNEYKVMVQVANPVKSQDSAASDEPDFVTYTSYGSSLQEAFRNVIKESPRKIYGTHMQVLVISERLAREDLANIMDFLFREPEIRLEFSVVIEKEDDKEDNNDNNDNNEDKDKALKTITVLDNLSSSNIESSLEAETKYLGTSMVINFEQLMNVYLNKYKEIVLPSLYVKGDINLGEEEENIKRSSNYTSVIIDNLAVFKDSKLLGYLSDKESISYNFITGNIKNTLASYNCDNGGSLVTEILKSKTSLDGDLKKKKIKVKIKGEASINENTCNYDLTSSKVIKEINDKVNDNIKEMVEKSFYNIRDTYNSDIWGLGDLFYKSDYKEFSKIEDKWEKEIFPEIKIEVDPEINLNEKGNILGGIYDKQKN